MMQRRHFVLAGLAACAAPTGLASLAQAQGFSQSRAADGVREALTQAARLATTRLGRHDGFWGDPVVRIPLPREIAAVQSRLRPLGLSGYIDDIELSLNRAAETAMPAARDIVVNSVSRMTVQDAVGIVQGGDTSATDYLRRASGPLLAELLEPRMQGTLRDAGAYAALDRVEPYVDQGNSFLNRFGLGRVNTQDLADQVTDHAVDKALDGVFHYIGVEERAIRRDPLGQASSLLRQVFG